MASGIELVCACCLERQLAPSDAAARLRCVRCRARLRGAVNLEAVRQRVRALALAALILYPFAMLLPVLRVSRLGHSHETGILGGGIDLLLGGEVLLGVLVLVCSVLFPLVKLLGLLLLTRRDPLATRVAGPLLRIIEGTGRWGMLDVLLVATLAALVKLGELVRIEAGPGATTFILCVGLGLAASALFDPRLAFTRRTEGGA